QSVAGGEFHAQEAARHFDGSHPLRVGPILDARARAPRQEFGVAADVIDQIEHLFGGESHHGAAFDDLQTEEPVLSNRGDTSRRGILAPRSLSEYLTWPRPRQIFSQARRSRRSWVDTQ